MIWSKLDYAEAQVGSQFVWGYQVLLGYSLTGIIPPITSREICLRNHAMDVRCSGFAERAVKCSSIGTGAVHLVPFPRRHVGE